MILRPQNRLLRSIENWTGHSAEKLAVIRFLFTCAGVLLLALAFLFLTGCRQLPQKRPDGTIDMGRTLMTKTATETIAYTNGTETFTYSTTGADETVVPSKVSGSITTLGLAKELTSGLRTTESTKRILAKEETARAAKKLDAGNEALRIKTPVLEPEIPTVTPPPSTGSFNPDTGLNQP